MTRAGTSEHVVAPATARRAVFAGVAGNCLEWFDFGLYSYLSLTIGRTFFPAGDDLTALLYSFGVFAVAFVVRPVGSFVWGPLGDRWGRQRVLVLTVVLMSVATCAIGLLPSYAMAGAWAPVLLIVARMLQGFSASGEVGSAATFVAEYAPARRRGAFASWFEFGTLTGFAAAAGLVAVLTTALPPSAMASWGWRAAFLVAAPLGLVGLYLRYRLTDSPAFRTLEYHHGAAEAPLRDTLRGYWRSVLTCIGVLLVYATSYYVVLTYIPSYLGQTLGISEIAILLTNVGVAIAMMVMVPIVGMVADRIGRRRLLVTACLSFIVASYPLLVLVRSHHIAGVITGIVLLGLCVAVFSGTWPSTLPMMFPTAVRSTAFTISWSVAVTLFGGTAPYIITYLVEATANPFMPAFYLMLAGAISLGPALLVKDASEHARLDSAADDGA